MFRQVDIIRGLGARLRAAGQAVARHAMGASRVEAACMAFALAGAATALGVTVAQATLTPVILTPTEMRAVAADAPGTLCPDGWAADHAVRLGMTEAEVMGWYLREAVTLSDGAVLASAGMVLTQVDPDGPITVEAAARHQILLCVAESRRMTQPAETLIPPELRDV